MSDCGKYLIVSIVKACRDNLLYFADLEKNGEITGKIPLTPIVTEFVADYDVNTDLSDEITFRNFMKWMLLIVVFIVISSISQILVRKWFSVRIRMHPITV